MRISGGGDLASILPSSKELWDQIVSALPFQHLLISATSNAIFNHEPLSKAGCPGSSHSSSLNRSTSPRFQLPKCPKIYGDIVLTLKKQILRCKRRPASQT